MPTAAPFTAASVGVSVASIAPTSGVIGGFGAASSARVASIRGSPHAFVTSSPAQNPLPAPVSTMQPTAGSASASAKQWMSSCSISKVAAFAGVGAVQGDRRHPVGDVEQDRGQFHQHSLRVRVNRN